MEAFGLCLYGKRRKLIRRDLSRWSMMWSCRVTIKGFVSGGEFFRVGEWNTLVYLLVR